MHLLYNLKISKELLMKAISVIFMTFFAFITAVNASQQADVNEVRANYHTYVVKELVSKEFPGDAMKGKVLEKGAVEALKYDSPQYVEEHGQALLWLEDLNNKGVLTDFAN